MTDRERAAKIVFDALPGDFWVDIIEPAIKEAQVRGMLIAAHLIEEVPADQPNINLIIRLCAAKEIREAAKENMDG